MIETTYRPVVTPGAPRSLPALESPRAPGERLALVVMAAAVALLPYLVPAGPLNTAPVDLVIALGIGLTLFWAGTNAEVLRVPYSLGVGLLCLGGAIGAMVGPVSGAGLVALLQDFVLLAWVAALMNLARRPHNLQVLLAAWCYAAVAWTTIVFVGLVAHVPFLAGITAREGSRVSLLLGDPNFAGNYFFVSIMLVWATGVPRHRSGRFLTYVALLTALLLTGSNSAVTSLVVGVAIVGIVTVHRRAGMVQAIGALAAVILMGALLINTVSFSSIQRAAAGSRYPVLRDGIGRSGTSVEQRDLLFHESIGLFYEGSLLGTGPTSTKTLLMDSQSLFVKEAHSDYWASLIERGVVGFLGLLILVASILTRSWHVLSRPLSAPFARVVTRPEALVAAAVGCLMAGTVFEVLHVRHIWFVFALVAVLSIWGSDDA